MYHWLVWKVLFPLQEWAKGQPTLRILKQMEALDGGSAAELQQFQAIRLREFIAYTYTYVPYVRSMMQRLGLKPSDIHAPADLVRLPLMRKADIRQNRKSLRSERAGKLKPFSTGGSTGEPLLFDLPQERIAAGVACRQRVSRWWGVSVGDPEIALWGSPVELTRQDWLRRQRDKLFRTRLLSAFEMNDETMSRYLEILERKPCRQVFAYPSAIYLLCLHARKQRRNLRRLGIRVVFVTGEVLYPFQRELITDTLNCPVADGYGGRDSGFIAHECPQGGMHIMADALIVEVVDATGRPLPAGERGEIAVTDLYSREAPFLRYATGDLGVLSERQCPCGRALPLLERIDGRSNDVILSPDGRIINALSLIYPLREVDGIEQFRIFQKRVDWLHVQIVPTEIFPKEGEQRIRHGWSKLLRCPLEVTFEYVEHLAPEQSGKFRHVVSDLAGGQMLRKAGAVVGTVGKILEGKAIG